MNNILLLSFMCMYFCLFLKKGIYVSHDHIPWGLENIPGQTLKRLFVEKSRD